MNTDLLKMLTGAGIGSRRKIADAILKGKVKINGIVADNLRQPVNPDTDQIVIDGKPVEFKPQQFTYVVMNKPKDLISTASDEQGRRTVLDILPDKYRHLRLYPVGRLDKDSTGLLLLTNDGDLTFHLTHPRFEQEKEYLLQIEGRLNSADRKKLEQGIELEDGKTSPATIKETNSSPYNYSIILREGKKRQVRRMFANLEYRVISLKRIRMGTIKLGNLKEGQLRELTGTEMAQLKGKNAGKKIHPIKRNQVGSAACRPESRLQSR